MDVMGSDGGLSPAGVKRPMTVGFCARKYSEEKEED
jgi:hypothetical protein